jgi:hypothetical protein
LEFYLPLLSILLRAQKHDAIKVVIDNLIQTDPVGNPQERSVFAHVIMKHGHPEKAMSIAYQAVCEGEQSAEVHSAFCTLILMNTRLEANERVVPNATRIQQDTWVRLENKNGDFFEFLISDPSREPSHLFQRVFPIDHALVAQCAGQSVGYEFEVKRPFNLPSVSWKVVELQHKYRRACHLIMSEYSERFPESKLMERVQIFGDDVEPILNYFKDQSQRMRTQADLYVEQGFPISVVAALFNTSSIELAHNMRAEGYNIAASHGNDAERRAAHEIINAKRQHGVVIDAYTAWTISTLGAFDIIKRVFGEIRLAQSCFDEITKLLIAAENKDTDSFSMYWREGKLFRDEMSTEQITAQLSFLKNLHVDVLTNCEIVPSEAPDEIPDVSRELIKNFSADLLDPVFCCMNGGLLLTEDMRYRTLAHQEFGCEGIWLQAVFIYAVGMEVLPFDDYCKLVVGLAHRKHSHLSVEGTTLANLVISQNGFGEDDLAAVTEYIGNKTADIQSHFLVASEAIILIWLSSQLRPTIRQSACSVILRSLIRFRGNDWSDMLAMLYVKSPRSLRGFMISWLQGHFLPMRDFSDKVKIAMQLDFGGD